MAKDVIKFKGVKEGVYIYVDTDDLEAAKRELADRMEKYHHFYQGIRLLDLFSETLSSRDIIELKLILRYKYDLIVLDEELPAEVFEQMKKKHEEKLEDTKAQVLQEEPMNEMFQGIDCGITKFVYGTIRSGQEIFFDGNLVIIGDVNPGAIVSATGNVIVMGNFRGVAHVGADGNDEAILACYNLQPIQVRIAERIAIKPDEDLENSRVPEIVRLVDGEVNIEPYLPNK